MTSHELHAILDQLPLHDRLIRVGYEDHHLIGVVASSDFEGQHEGIRQETVWKHLLAALSRDQRAEVEFVYTFTREELAALDRGERPASWGRAS